VNPRCRYFKGIAGKRFNVFLRGVDQYPRRLKRGHGKERLAVVEVDRVPSERPC
jgi:hypothetical protein